MAAATAAGPTRIAAGITPRGQQHEPGDDNRERHRREEREHICEHSANVRKPRSVDLAEWER